MSSTESAVPDISVDVAPIVRGEPVEIADGIHVIPDNRVLMVPNVGIVVGTHAALVVDTGLGPRNGKYVLEQACALAGERPLYLTLTHFHAEHGFGAQAFKGAATIIYNRAQREESHQKAAGQLAMFRELGPGVAAELEGVEFVDPDVVYDGTAELDLGGHKVTLHEAGPAHTASDQVIVVDDRVLFTGDLIETRMFPIVPYFPPFDTDVDPAGWIRALDERIAANPEIVVPGHGELGDTRLLVDVRDYLVHIRDETERLRTAGVSVDDAVATIEKAARTRWSTWEYPEWIGFAVRACYAA